VADLQISALPPLAGTLLQGTDPFPVADLSASETKRISAADLAAGLGALFPANSIPSTAVNLVITPGSITTALLANKAVSAAKLDDQSSAVVAATTPATGAFIGQLSFNSTGDTLRIWDGSVWQALKAAGSINTLAYDNTVGPVALAGAASGDSVTLSARLNPTSAAAQFLAGPSGAGGAATYRTIGGTDLPTASATAKGAIEVSGNGLRVTGSRLEIDNDITASAGVYGLVDVNAKGLVIGSRRVQATDLPIATTTTVGAVMPGSDLTVTAAGTLDHAIKIAGGGIYTKLTVNATGHITAGAQLTAGDIPSLDAAKITSGTLPISLLADHSVTAQKLADYAIALIQESVPVAGVGSHPIGMTWLQESTGQVSIWNGNSWMKTGASTLFNRNLRYCGTYNPGTGVINGVTQFGTADGFKVGDTIPAADDKHAGVYFVATTGGTSASIAGGATFDAGDWLLCQGTTGGWVRIDTLSGAGGGGGVGGGTDHLDGLLDVTLTNPKAGDVLHYTAAGQWVNVAFTDAGTYA